MNLLLRRFQPEKDFQATFDCGNDDLNDYLLETAADRQNAAFNEKELMAITYIVENRDSHDILAYFSLLHDKIERDVIESDIWNRLSRRIPNVLRRSSYPALKIGRLAVNIPAQSTGIGTMIVNYIETKYLVDMFAGCRFITVDALNSAQDFYRKNHFLPLKRYDSPADTTPLFFDLKSLL